jgi:hypothetical protein
MTPIKKIAGPNFLPAIFLVIATSVATSGGIIGIAFSQSSSNQTVEVMNETAAELNQTLPESMNQTAAELNQSAAQMGNQTTANQTQSTGPKLTMSDVEDIRSSLEEVKKSIADGKAVEALQTINDIDDKLLVAMSENPPPMLEKSNGNGEGEDN